MAQIRSKPFGVTRQGANVTEYILSNPGGLTVSVLDYGCIIKNIIVPAKNGPVDVVLGHDTMADYEDDFTSSGSTCCGAFVGRYANRIENAVFSVGGKTYQLEANNGPNHLHGCFSRKLYRVKAFGDTLLMEAESPDGEDGFPGNLKLAVRYTLTEDNTFRMDYRVSSDADTIVNLTNHSYFNLNGEGDVLGQKLRIYASNYLEGNNQTCPTGAILPGHRHRLCPDHHGGRRLRPLLCHRPRPGLQPEHLCMGHQRKDRHQHEAVHHPAGHPAVHRQLPAGLSHPRQGRRAHAEVRRLCIGDPALSLQPFAPGVPHHCAAGGQGVPCHHDPAVLHRQAVRETLKMMHHTKTSAPAGVFCVAGGELPQSPTATTLSVCSRWHGVSRD